MAILEIFWSFFGDRMANLGLIDFKLGLYIKVNVNHGQNKFEVHTSYLKTFGQNGHQLAQNRPDATFGQEIEEGSLTYFIKHIVKAIFL